MVQLDRLVLLTPKMLASCFSDQAKLALSALDVGRDLFPGRVKGFHLSSALLLVAVELGGALIYGGRVFASIDKFSVMAE